MTSYSVTIINESFRSCADVAVEGLDAARAQALKSALEIGSEEVCAGVNFFGAEITIEHDGATVHRSMVSIGTSPLQ